MKPGRLIALFACVVALMTALAEFYFGSDLYQLLSVTFLVFFSSFVIFYYLIEYYLNSKIQIIYKLISNLKVDKDLKEVMGSHVSADPIKDVEAEVKKWANDKRAEIEELKKHELFRREFLANLSHELKTPLFGAQGYVQTTIDSASLDEVSKNYLLKADKNIERLCLLVSDLDEITKLETGEIKLNISSFILSDLVKEIIDDFELKQKQFNIQIRFDAGVLQGVSVSADLERIYQVFQNLIDNSLKYGTSGGETKISLFDLGKDILVEVTDNGIGISEKHLSRLFERFYRTDESRNRKIGGTGLGLAIVKHILESHHQSIHVRSTPGIGTTFAFTLTKIKK
jgi:two-component system phosphate regulon sensor histidine kinase PhoR